MVAPPPFSRRLALTGALVLAALAVGAIRLVVAYGVRPVTTGSLLGTVCTTTGTYAWGFGLLIPPLARLRWGASRDRLAIGLDLGALAVLALQAVVMVAIPYESLYGDDGVAVVSEPGWGWRLQVAATAVAAGAAFFAALRLIGRRGVGPGSAWLALAFGFRTLAEPLWDLIEAHPDLLAPLGATSALALWAGHRLTYGARPGPSDPGWTAAGLPPVAGVALALGVIGLIAERDGVSLGPFALPVATVVFAWTLAVILRRPAAVVAAAVRYTSERSGEIAAEEAVARPGGRARAAVLAAVGLGLWVGLPAVSLSGGVEPAVPFQVVGWFAYVGALVAEVREARAHADCTVPVWTTHKVYEAAAALAFFEAAGLRGYARGLAWRGLVPFDLYAPITLEVPVEEEARALELLAKVGPPEPGKRRLAAASGDSVWSGPRFEG